MNWPWWQFSVALDARGLRRAARARPATRCRRCVGAFLVASLPLANVHVALAGYADLPMAAYYTGAALAFLRWTAIAIDARRGARAAARVACTQIKIPGLVWALTLLPGVVVALLPRHGLKLVAIGLAVALFALAVLAQTQSRRLQLPAAPRLRSRVARARRDALPAQQLASALVRRDRRRAARVAAACRAGARAAHRDRRRPAGCSSSSCSASPTRGLGDRADDDQPRDAAPRAARRRLRRARFRAFAERWTAAPRPLHRRRRRRRRRSASRAPPHAGPPGCHARLRRHREPCARAARARGSRGQTCATDARCF